MVRCGRIALSTNWVVDGCAFEPDCTVPAGSGTPGGSVGMMFLLGEVLVREEDEAFVDGEPINPGKTGNIPPSAVRKINTEASAIVVARCHRRPGYQNLVESS